MRSIRESTLRLTLHFRILRRQLLRMTHRKVYLLFCHAEECNDEASLVLRLIRESTLRLQHMNVPVIQFMTDDHWSSLRLHHF